MLLRLSNIKLQSVGWLDTAEILVFQYYLHNDIIFFIYIFFIYIYIHVFLVYSNILYVNWKDTNINIIDTPGESINHLFPNIRMYILLTVLYTFLKVLFWTCHSFVTEYPTVIIKDLQFELSSKTDEHVVMMFMCVKSKSSCQQHTCTPAVRWEF